MHKAFVMPARQLPVADTVWLTTPVSMANGSKAPAARLLLSVTEPLMIQSTGTEMEMTAEGVVSLLMRVNAMQQHTCCRVLA